MLIQVQKAAFILFAAAYILFTHANVANAAGTFTPPSGTVVTASPMTIGWNSTASQQWIRIYDTSTGAKIFDSGRQVSMNGSISAVVADDISEIRIVFFEKTSAGGWENQQRILAVNINGQGTGGSGPVIVSQRITCTDEVGPQLPAAQTQPAWQPFDYQFDWEGSPALTCNLSCPQGEYLMAVDCVSGFLVGLDNTSNRRTLVSELKYSDASTASCSMYEQTEAYAYLGNGPDINGTGLKEFVWALSLDASGACMSIR
ncbi:MAG: hypothetical protein KTR35_04430 [Gammaproteobacteria bacterium]|nr:hypothetical protein [Gammaproteobacteria bacterium]